MRTLKQIPQRIPELIVPVPLSPSSKELFRSRLKEYRKQLSVVLVSLEQEFGQSLGVVSHLFAVWRVVAERRESFSYYVVLVCCWWLTQGNKRIKRSDIVKLTGLGISQCSNHLHTALGAGYLEQHRSRQHYRLTNAGSEYIKEFFSAVLVAVLDLYDDNQ